jgi:hypothetical protein
MLLSSARLLLVLLLLMAMTAASSAGTTTTILAARNNVTGGDRSPCHACGYACDADCNCGRCNTKPGCQSQSQCLGPCDSGHNAKWCGGGPAPPSPPSPSPPSPSPKPTGNCQGCGYACDADCNCGHCNTKSGCMSNSTCLGACDSGHNAKWCGPKAPPPPPPLPPAPPAPEVRWTTAANKLQKDGHDVVLHGIGTTCTEYLLRGIGMKCFVEYEFDQPAQVLSKLDPAQIGALVTILRQVATDTTIPAVRIPMTASSWLGLHTNASAANMAKYPDLSAQYRRFIANLVTQYTGHGIVAILDLHWSNDDIGQAPMADKTAIQFWSQIAEFFGNNSYVFYELYNEPHTDYDTYANGDATHAGMLEMLAAVRSHRSGLFIAPVRHVY